MTNFLRSFALDAIFASAAIFAAGCGCGSSGDPVKNLSAGMKSFEQKDYPAAIRYCRAAVEADPDNVDALLVLAQAEFCGGSRKEADACLERAAKLAGDDIDVIEVEAQFAFMDRDYDRAIAQYRRLADDDTLDAATRAKGWNGIGVVDYMKSDAATGELERDRLCAKARTDFLRASKLDRYNVCAKYHLGRIYRDTYHFFPAARDAFEAYVHLEKADFHRRDHVRDEILPAIKKDIRDAAPSVRVAPGGSEACAELLKKADIAFNKKNFDTAKNLYADAMKKDGQSAPAAIGYAKALAATAKDAAGHKAASRAYIAACKLVRDKDVYLKAGEIAIKAKNYASAAEMYSCALAYYPADPKVVDGLVNALKACGKTDLATVYRHYGDFLSRGK